MGVKACNRKDCENIMCDRYNGHYGYICDECFYEMVNSKLSVYEFMAMSKYNKGDTPRTLEFYSLIFTKE